MKTLGVELRPAASLLRRQRAKRRRENLALVAGFFPTRGGESKPTPRAMQIKSRVSTLPQIGVSKAAYVHPRLSESPRPPRAKKAHGWVPWARRVRNASPLRDPRYRSLL